MRESRSARRKVCSAVGVVPLNHAVGIVPSGSPVPGTM